MKKSLKIKTAVCGALCLVASQACGGTYAVPGQYATIQAAINAAADNSVINVAPGVYNENLNTGTKMMISVVGTGGAAATIIDGGNVAPIITVGNNTKMPNMPVVLNGFTLQNGYSATTGGVTTLATGSTLTITNSIVRNNHAGSGAAFAVTGGTLKINNSVISNNTAVSAGGAFYAVSGSTTLTNNTIAANVAAEGASINQLYGAGIGGANNIVYGNLKDDGTANYPVINGPITATFTYSDVEGGLTGTGNINADPLFVDAAAGNFQLAAGSPAIDAAQAGITTDITGIARPQGAATDMGAYEYVAPAPPPVNGTCGSSNGAIFTTAPTANLCSVGIASAVTGTGPFSWTCAGSNGGTTASCTAQLQVVTPPADVTPPTAVSFVTSGTSGSTAAISVTFSEAIAATKPLGMVVKIGTFNTAVTVSGSVATIKLMSCCVPLLKPGVEYTLTIPAGSFRDAAGNLNALITAPVTFGSAPAPVNGTCGSANGAIFTAAPAVNLCTAGTASAVTGTGPFTWTCAGSNGGTTASCSAQLQLVTPPPATDTTPPAAVSVDVTNGATVASSFITVTFTEGITATRFLDTIMKIGTADTTNTVSGSTVTIKVKSCCLNKVKTGSTYNLSIPAGSFKDAAGNVNAAISVPVTFGTIPPPAVDTTLPAVVATVVAKGATVASDVITVNFSETVTATRHLDTIMKIGTADTTNSVSGSTVTVKVKSCCLNKVKTGSTYNLTIPAGSFKDAAGNLNSAISVPVTL